MIEFLILSALGFVAAAALVAGMLWIAVKLGYLRAKPPKAPKFDKTYCSNCGREFGPGDHGYSHCENH